MVEIMAVIVVNTSITADYFKNEMDAYELQYIINELNSKYKNEWEKIRFNNYILSKVMTGKPDKPTDFMAFDWDLEYKKDENIKKMKI